MMFFGIRKSLFYNGDNLCFVFGCKVRIEKSKPEYPPLVSFNRIFLKNLFCHLCCKRLINFSQLAAEFKTGRIGSKFFKFLPTTLFIPLLESTSYSLYPFVHAPFFMVTLERLDELV